MPRPLLSPICTSSVLSGSTRPSGEPPRRRLPEIGQGPSCSAAAERSRISRQPAAISQRRLTDLCSSVSVPRSISHCTLTNYVVHRDPQALHTLSPTRSATRGPARITPFHSRIFNACFVGIFCKLRTCDLGAQAPRRIDLLGTYFK